MDVNHAHALAPGWRSDEVRETRKDSIEPDYADENRENQATRIEDTTERLSFWRNARVGSGVMLNGGRSRSRNTFTLERRTQIVPSVTSHMVGVKQKRTGDRVKDNGRTWHEEICFAFGLDGLGGG